MKTVRHGWPLTILISVIKSEYVGVAQKRIVFSVGAVFAGPQFWAGAREKTSRR